MKAKDWIVKFEAVPASDAPVQEHYAELLKEFGVETAELVAARTKTSKPESRFHAADGAVREQKGKFRSICGHVPGLTEELFDKLLTTTVPDYFVWQKQAQTQKKEPKEDVRNYRRSGQRY